MILRYFIRKRRLRKDASDVATEFLPLSKIRSAFILVEGSAEGVDPCSEAISKMCAEKGIDLNLMYIDLRKFNKKVRPATDLSKTITRRKLNWYGRPKPKKIGDAATKPVDLYISMTDSDSYCVKYLASSVRARFKIGQKAYNGDPYNFVVGTAPVAEGEMAPVMNAEAIFLKIKDLLNTIH